MFMVGLWVDSLFAHSLGKGRLGIFCVLMLCFSYFTDMTFVPIKSYIT